MMRRFFLILLVSAGCMLSACRDDQDSAQIPDPNPPQPSNCKIHCAP